LGDVKENPDPSEEYNKLEPPYERNGSGIPVSGAVP